MAEKLLDAPLLTPAPGALLDALLGDGDAPGAPPAPPRVYAARWWVLLQYALFTALQGWAWAIPGSVSDTYLDLYAPAVDSWTIQVFLNYGAVLFCLVAFPVGYAMDKPGGIKQQVLLASALVTAGAVLRCCATDAGVGSVVCLHASFILTALAGPAAMSAVAKLSEEWFPPNERTTATSVATLCNGVGTAFSSLVGPAMVAGGDAGSLAPLQRYNYVMLALIAANLLMMAAYFPAAPPTPPSASAAVSRAAGAALTPAKLWGVLRAVARNRNVVVLALVYGVGGGAQAGWGGLMNLNLNSVGVDQYSAGMIGFVSALVGNMAGVAVGAYADRARAFKRLCVGGSVVGALATAWIVAALQGALPAAWSTPGALTPGFFLAFTLTYGTGFCVICTSNSTSSAPAPAARHSDCSVFSPTCTRRRCTRRAAGPCPAAPPSTPAPPTLLLLLLRLHAGGVIGARAPVTNQHRARGRVAPEGERGRRRRRRGGWLGDRRAS
jgi:FLVCR family MFS transporter